MAEYDYYKAKKEGYRPQINYQSGIWANKSMLPVFPGTTPVSLREGNSPILELKKMTRTLSQQKMYLKNEALNPGGSLRDREMSVLFSAPVLQRFERVVVESTGNVGISASMYANLTNIPSLVLMPRGYPVQFLGECQFLGASVQTISWNKSIREEVKKKKLSNYKYFDISEQGHTFRIEGAKSIFYEVLNQFSGSLPEAWFIPVGEGITLIGIWLAIKEALKLGWLRNESVPKIWAVQSANCATLSEYLDSHREGEFKDTIAFDLYAPESGLIKIVAQIMQEMKWNYAVVTDEEILTASKEIAQSEGILVAPEGGACLAALKNILKSQREHWDSVLILNPSLGSRYIHSIGFINE